MKKKNRNGDICRGAIDFEFGRDWSVGLGAPLGDGHTEKFLKNSSVLGIFSGKAESVTSLGFECTVNPQHLINFVGAIFERIENFIIFFFLCELSLILREVENKNNG